VLYDTREQKRGMLALAAHERMVTVGTLAAGVGHEINNPLTYVIGNLDLLHDEVQAVASALDPRRRDDLFDLVSEARDGAERIRKIVRGLRTFARGEREERAPIDVRGCVDVALQLAQSALRHVTHVACDLRPTPPVLADESQLVQVLVNLLVNAAHALGPTPMSRNLVRVCTRPDDEGRVVIEVADNGPGMADDVARRVFEPFFTTKGVREGTGLGLSIVHNIVAGFGGAVVCETAPGAGATFRVTLPAAPTA
jgi:two-component system NtrC family sensor kinase